MNSLKKLYCIADRSKISVLNYNMKNSGILAASIRLPNNIGIFIDYDNIKNSAEEKSLLSHEIGHCKTGAMYSTDSPLEIKERCEYKADKWAVHNIIPFHRLKEAAKKGYTEIWELAEYFNVTEEFINTAFKVYQNEGKMCN